MLPASSIKFRARHRIMTSKAQRIGMWSLLMINLAALGGIRNWAPMAETGLSSVFFLVLAVLAFFLPISLVSAELATSWPQSGGIYGWVKEAFGHRLGFLSIWLLWVENLIWYPTVLSFIVSTITYAFAPDLIHNKTYMVSLILLFFWGTTLVNLKGLRASSWLSFMGAVCGTFVPSILLILFGIFWFVKGGPIHISFSKEALVPELSSFSQLALLGSFIVSLLGIEMSAVHVADVKSPQKNYPKAIFLSALVVILFSLLGVLSIAIVVPHGKILLSAGCLQAFDFFLEAYGCRGLLPWIGIMIGLGALGSVSTWILGPSKGLIAAAREEDLPRFLRKVNGAGMPNSILFVQALLVSVFALLFFVLPSLNSAYWILLVLTTQLYLIIYLLLFASAIRLRYSQPEVSRPFRVLGGNVGIWAIGGVGFVSSLFALLVCFFPTSQIQPGNEIFYISFLMGAILLVSLLPFWISRRKIKAIQADSNSDVLLQKEPADCS